jgi:hypothetical protein
VILYEKVRSEARDEAWAEGKESAIRRRVMQVPLVGKNGNVLRVTCGNSLCEIAGTVVAPQDKAEPYDQRSRFNRTEKALQGPSLSDDLAKLGLQVDGASFAFGKDKPDQLTFVLYYSRANIRGPSRRLPPLP